MTGPSAPRLAPLSGEQWGDDARAALWKAFPGDVAQRFFSTGADAIPMPNALATMMHNPALAGPFLTYNNVLLQTPALGHRARELVVLRVASRTRCSYEWAQHVRLAARSGVSPAEIDAIAHGTDADGWTPLEADLLAATDQLIDGYRLDDETWSRLAEQLDERQLVELVFVVGTYTGLAMAFNSFRLQLDADLQETANATTLEFEE